MTFELKITNDLRKIVVVANNCTKCDHFYRNTCGEFGYYFKDHVAKRTTCKLFEETEQ